ncbi:hypothetical protein BGX34_007807 [Mortierella sp. NVP85]|nr:hypothetical protein BGX34_007807 [Mortierella sp. NVP85]
MALRQLPTSIANPFQLGTENDMSQQKEPHMFQLQMDELVQRMQQTNQKMEEVLEKTQQTDQQREHTQQQTQDQIVQILQTLQQTSRQHTEESERITQQLNLQRQQWEEALRTSQQNQYQQFEAVQQRLEQLDQDSRQQIQHIRQQTQQQIDKALNDVHQLGQNAQHSQLQHEQSLQQMRGMGKARQDHDRLLPKLRRREVQYAFNQFGGSHSMTKNCDTPHEVHLANHPGYDLENQDEFINKYRSYLLTMLYMVKHGVKTRGLLVQPLLGLDRAIGEDEIMGQLVDDTISHLKEATGCIDGDTAAYQNLDATELSELKSYLKVKDDEDFSGGLSRITIQKAYYAWICSDHLREYYDSTLQQQSYKISASVGVWHGNEVEAKVTSEAITQLLYALGIIFRIQNVEYWRCITGIDMKLNSQQSASGPTTDILSSLDDLESLSLGFGRFTMSVKDIFQDEIKDVVISISELGALTLDDFEFIHQCRPVVLIISETPQKKDDNRLVSIIQQNPSITTLRVVCDVERHIAVIDLVCSTREKMLQSGTQPALRMFELVHPEIKLEVSFDEGSPALDMPPCINLEDCQSYTVEPAVYNFIRQHGWSDITFVVPESFSDRLAQLLDESMQETGSRIARLDITPTSLTTQGLDALSRVINQSQGLTYLRLSLGNLHLDDQLEKALLLLQRHKDRLTSLRLEGQHVDQWLSRIAQHFPNNDGFPVLEELFLGGLGTHWISDITYQWIAWMV